MPKPEPARSPYPQPREAGPPSAGSATATPPSSAGVRPTFLNLPAAKQARIIDAALTEFAEQGYAQASMNTVVARSNIAKGSLYQYFSDKQGIFLYIFEFGIALIRRTLIQVKDSTRDEDFFTRLERSLLAGVDFIRQHPRLYGVYLKILFDQHMPQRATLLQSVRQFAAEYFHSLIKRGRQRGEIRPDLSPEAMIFLLDAVFDRFLQAVCVPYFDVTLGLNTASEDALRHRITELMHLLRAGYAR